MRSLTHRGAGCNPRVDEKLGGSEARSIPMDATSPRRNALKKHIEVNGEPAVTFAKENPGRWVAGVPMDCFRIEVVRQVEPADSQPHRIFFVHLEIAPHTGIRRQEARKTGRVRNAYIVLRFVHNGIGKPATVLENGRDSETMA